MNNITRSYDLYQGTFESNEITQYVKQCHQFIKNFIIAQFSNNIDLLIDIGSGRGHDYEAWVQNNIKKVIGIEPSEKSIESAIRKYKKQNKNHKFPKIMYIHAIGNELFNTGKAALDDNAKNILIKFFKYNLHADCIHMFWTIHYCMNTKHEFLNLFVNINTNLKTNGFLIILSMNGKLIHNMLQKHNGHYKNIDDKNNVLFEIISHYDHNNKIANPFGNTIGIRLSGTYGLDTEIHENLVSRKFLTNFFQKKNYEVVLCDNFINYAARNNIECVQKLNIFQKRISIFYDIIVLKKK